MATKRFLPVLPSNLTLFEKSVMTGDPDMRSATPEDVRDLQLVYRREQARQLHAEMLDLGIDPNEVEFIATEFEKNLCPSTGLESEAGVLYNTRTGVTVGVVLEWVCEWSCTMHEWRGEYEPKLSTCKPVYFLNGLRNSDVEALK
jgi:hypothetical protein